MQIKHSKAAARRQIKSGKLCNVMEGNWCELSSRGAISWRKNELEVLMQLASLSSFSLRCSLIAVFYLNVARRYVMVTRMIARAQVANS